MKKIQFVKWAIAGLGSAFLTGCQSWMGMAIATGLLAAGNFIL